MEVLLGPKAPTALLEEAALLEAVEVPAVLETSLTALLEEAVLLEAVEAPAVLEASLTVLLEEAVLLEAAEAPAVLEARASRPAGAAEAYRCWGREC